MNIGGMGTLELIIVFLIAFIFLGPQRMSEAAKFLGKLVRDVRRMTADIPELILEDDGKRVDTRLVRRLGGPESALTKRPIGSDKPAQGDQQPPDQDAPVAFKPGSEPTPEDDDESTPARDRP